MTDLHKLCVISLVMILYWSVANFAYAKRTRWTQSVDQWMLLCLQVAVLFVFIAGLAIRSQPDSLLANVQEGKMMRLGWLLSDWICFYCMVCYCGMCAENNTRASDSDLIKKNANGFYIREVIKFSAVNCAYWAIAFFFAFEVSFFRYLGAA